MLTQNIWAHCAQRRLVGRARWASGGGGRGGVWVAMLVGWACLLGAMPSGALADSQTTTTGIPVGPSPNAAKQTLMMDIYSTQNGKVVKTTVSVPNVPQTAGLPFPTPAQVAAASAAKAKAVAAAVNAANIPGVMASVEANTVQGPYVSGFVVRNVPPFGLQRVPLYSNANFSQFTVTGVTAPPNPDGTPGQAVQRTPGNTVTGELGDGRGPVQKGGGGGGGSMNSPSKMSYNGGGATDMASGLDVAGDQSVVEFGFIDYNGASPLDYVEGIAPTSGMTDATILGTLATEFNDDYESDGYSATYDPTADSLSIDQALPGDDFLFEGDSDTGTEFDSETDSVPEPGMGAVLMVGVVGAMRRRGTQERR